MYPNHTSNAPEAQQTVETWREIPGFDGRYEVSDQGRVRAWYYRRGGQRQAEPLYINIRPTRLGYVSCRLWLGDKGNGYFVHRLVMLAFVGSSELTVNHKDGNKQNNCLANLEYMTHADNVRHSFQHLGRKAVRGQESGQARLTDAQVDWLRQLAAEGKSNVELAQIFDVNLHYVSNLKLGKVRG